MGNIKELSQKLDRVTTSTSGLLAALEKQQQNVTLTSQEELIVSRLMDNLSKLNHTLVDKLNKNISKVSEKYYMGESRAYGPEGEPIDKDGEEIVPGRFNPYPR